MDPRPQKAGGDARADRYAREEALKWVCEDDPYDPGSYALQLVTASHVAACLRAGPQARPGGVPAETGGTAGERT